jgi:hypothetical protein
MAEDITLSCQDDPTLSEIQLTIGVFIMDHESPYLMLQINKFGVFYPDQNNEDHFYFTFINRVNYKDLTSEDHIYLLWIVIFLTVFRMTMDEPCPHPRFTHTIPVM